LLVFPAFAQRLTTSLGNPAARRLILSAEMPQGGSFELQRSSNILSNWVTLTNFNAFPGTNTFSDSRTNQYRFYRLVQFTVPPAITNQPQGTTNFFDQEVRLEAGATGSWPLRFQWYKDGEAVPGATSNKLVFNGRSPLSGNYSLIVSNLWGMAASTPVTVKTINPVAASISGRTIHFVIKGAEGGFLPAGTFDTDFSALGSYDTDSSSPFLEDVGYWQYFPVAENAGRIFLSASVVYQNAQVTLAFQTQTNGTYTLVVPNVGGGQWGDFRF
jgi:hypothetical protein